MTFMTISSVILQYMLIIQLFIVSMIWKQLELASEFKSDLRDTVEWDQTWLVDFNAGKIQLVSFDRFNNNSYIDVKMDGPVLEEKPSFKMLGFTFSSKLDWGSCIISEALIRSLGFISAEVALYLYKSTIHITEVMSILMFFFSYFLLKIYYVFVWFC